MESANFSFRRRSKLHHKRKKEKKKRDQQGRRGSIGTIEVLGNIEEGCGPQG